MVVCLVGASCIGGVVYRLGSSRSYSRFLCLFVADGTERHHNRLAKCISFQRCEAGVFFVIFLLCIADAGYGLADL